MNLNKYGRWSGIVAAVAMLAMVLQGCGGDDGGSGISQDMYDALQADYDQAVSDRDAAMAARMAAMEAQMTAETERDAAMEGQTAAEAAQVAAEARATAAVAAQAVADAAAATARQAAMDAEAAQMVAEAALEDAEDEAAAANLNVVRAEAAQAIAESAQMAAEAAQMRAETAQATAEAAAMAAMEAQEMAESAQAVAEAAQTKAEADLKVAQAAEMAAKTAQATAEAAQMKAEEDLAAAMAAQQMAEDDLATAIMERDAALAALATETDAEAAQRARVDAAAIQRSADDIISIRVDSDGMSVPYTVSSTNPVENYQGSDARPYVDLNGDGMDNEGTSMESVRITATHDGSMVEFDATAGSAAINETYFNETTAAGSGDMTTLMAQADIPGGHTKHIFLMSDIESPVTSVFGENPPANLVTNLFDAGFHNATQTVRYALVQAAAPTTARGAVSGISADGTAEVTDANGINVDLSSDIEVDLGVLAPSDAQPIQTTLAGASFSGSYAGNPGTYICNGLCQFTRNDDGELLIGAATAFLFVPDGAMRYQADADYLIYGAWLKKPDSAVGTGISAGLGAASNLFDADGDADAANDVPNGVAALTGDATYSGTAAGFFAERHVDADGAVSGTFTADAALTADFDGGSPVGADSVGMVSGTINNFVRSDGVSADWVVNLGVLDLGATADNTPDTDNTDPNDFVDGIPSATNTAVTSAAAGAFTPGTTSGSASGASWNGEWGMQLVGAGPDNASAAQHPNGIVGTFGAQHGSPARLTDEPGTGETIADQGFVGVIGGFGARID